MVLKYGTHNCEFNLEFDNYSSNEAFWNIDILRKLLKLECFFYR